MPAAPPPRRSASVSSAYRAADPEPPNNMRSYEQLAVFIIHLWESRSDATWDALTVTLRIQDFLKAYGVASTLSDNRFQSELATLQDIWADRDKRGHLLENWNGRLSHFRAGPSNRPGLAAVDIDAAMEVPPPEDAVALKRRMESLDLRQRQLNDQETAAKIARQQFDARKAELEKDAQATRDSLRVRELELARREKSAHRPVPAFQTDLVPDQVRRPGPQLSPHDHGTHPWLSEDPPLRASHDLQHEPGMARAHPRLSGNPLPRTSHLPMAHANDAESSRRPRDVPPYFSQDARNGARAPFVPQAAPATNHVPLPSAPSSDMPSSQQVAALLQRMDAMINHMGSLPSHSRSRQASHVDPAPASDGRSHDSPREPDRLREDRPPHRRPLRAQDIMLFDPDEVEITTFVNRLRFLERLEGEDAVLRVLPLCLKGRALEWHAGLSDDRQLEMMECLNSCIIELQNEFTMDETTAWDKAAQLTFTFASVDTLPLASYVTKKITLLRAAGITDDGMLKRLVWEGLDDCLAHITPLDKYESLEAFRHRARSNEASAYRAWKSNGRASNRVTRPADKEKSAARTGASGYQSTGAQSASKPSEPTRASTVTDTPKSSSTKGGYTKRADRPPIDYSKPPPRPCYTCGAMHWHRDCPSRTKVVNIIDSDRQAVVDAILDAEQAALDDEGETASDTTVSEN